MEKEAEKTNRREERNCDDPVATVDRLTDVTISPECEVNTHKHSPEVKSGFNIYSICNPEHWGIVLLGWD